MSGVLMMIVCVRVCCFIYSVCVVSFALWCGCVGVRVCVAQLDDLFSMILCVVWSPCHVSVCFV